MGAVARNTSLGKDAGKCNAKIMLRMLTAQVTQEPVNELDFFMPLFVHQGGTHGYLAVGDAVAFQRLLVQKQELPIAYNGQPVS